MTAVEHWPVLEDAPAQDTQDPLVIEADVVPADTDATPERLPVPVEEAEAPAVREPAGLPERQPRKILPDFAASPEVFLRYVRWEAHYAYSHVAYHSVRSGWYLLRLILRAPHGLWRCLRAWHRWVTVEVVWDFLRTLGRDEAPQFDRILRTMQVSKTVRWIITAAVALFLLGGWHMAEQHLEPLVLALGLVLVLGALGYAGRDPNHSIIDRGSYEAPRLTYELLLNALSVLGIPQLSKSIKDFGPQAIQPRSPIGYQGRGWRTEFDLPPGVPATEVVSARDRLAAGLGRPVSAVWPSGVPDEAANRLSLWVCEKPLSQMKPFVWPLTRTGQTSVFAPIVIGQDPMGHPVEVTPMFTSGVWGGIPGSGKSFSLRLLTLGAALDPTCEIHILNLKGGPDWSPLEPVAHRYRAGESEEDFDYALEDLREMAADMTRRYKLLEEIYRRDRSKVPEGKVTAELAADKDLGLHPVLLVVDETQVLFTKKQYKDEATALVSDLVRRGRAAGIMTHVATQRVSKETVPTSISSNAVLRFCLRVQSHNESNLVLGYVSGMGFNAATFGPKDYGICYMVGEGAEPEVVRFAYVDGPQSESVISRARAVRKRKGLLSGYAVGLDQETPDDEQVSPLQHIADVWPLDRPSLGYHEIAALLEDRHPVVYKDWTYRQVKDTCNQAGLMELGGIKLNGEPMGRGVRRDDLMAKLSNDLLDEPERGLR